MDLCNIKTLESLLKRHGFSFSHALGQNFIVDADVCPRMAELAGLDKGTGVLEIGPGVGVLTKELCARAGFVVAAEVDARLLPVLAETLREYGNAEVVHADILKTDVNALLRDKFKGFTTVKVCANLPYYITSPILMRLLEDCTGIDEIVVMVQKEAAERLCAGAGTKKTGAVSIAVAYRAETEVLFDVGRESFMPSPRVDSAVIRLKMRREKMPLRDEKQFFRTVRAAFSQRRKTAVNAISSQLGVPKARLSEAFAAAGIRPNARPEEMTIDEFAAAAEAVADLQKQA